jgi:hypothetical protein
MLEGSMTHILELRHLFASARRGVARARHSLVLGLGLYAAAAAWAAGPTVTFAANDLLTAGRVSGQRWEYVYTVNGPVDHWGSVTIDFAPSDYAELDTPAVPGDPVVDTGLLAFNFVSASFVDAGLADGSKAKFSVSFDWNGLGSPGSQAYDILDKDGFFVYDTPQWTAPTPPVPEPSAAALMLLGLMALSLKRVCAGSA